jgi:sirohydrochlorin ferrochelatase
MGPSATRSSVRCPPAPVLLGVAHGSRDPAAQATIGELLAEVARQAPGITVRAAFVQHAEPSLAGALASDPLGPLVIVPLLLAAGYHLGNDIGEAAGRAGVPVAAPLGPDPRLVAALASRLAAAGAPDQAPVVLAAAGSADPRATAATREQAALLAECRRAPVLAAYASAGRPTVPEAIAGLTARTGGPVAVAAYLLAPGLFHDRLRHSGAAWVSGPLGAHPAVAGLVLDRFRAAAPSALLPCG